MKRTLTIIIVAFFLILAGLLGYYFFFLKKEVPPPEGGRGGGPIFPLPPAGEEEGGGAIEEGGEPGETERPAAVPRLQRVSAVPAAGAAVYRNGEEAVVRYIERGSGNVYEYQPVSQKSSRLTNKTLPKIYEALWTGNPDRLLIRYLKDGAETVQTFEVLLDPASGTTTGNSLRDVTASFLEQNIRDIAVSPKGDRLFYLAGGSAGVAGIVSSTDGRQRERIFESNLVGWLADWPAENVITLTNSPTAGGAGFLYFLNPRSGLLSKVLGGLPGLTTLTNGDAGAVLLASSEGSSVKFSAFDVKTGESKDLPVRTLPEKCVWSKLQKHVVFCAVPKTLPFAVYPDFWYQGRVSFDDEIWKINTATGAPEALFSAADRDYRPFDAIGLTLDPKEEYLVFSDKKDLTLWLLKTK